MKTNRFSAAGTWQGRRPKECHKTSAQIMF
nr:MAG TPA: hypothetical protein [Caudoviricetes sp.]